MKRLIVVASLAAALLTVKTAAGQTGQPPVSPVILTEEHKRDILNYLDELKSLRIELGHLQRYMIRDEEQDKGDREIAAKKLQLAEQERDQAKQQADHYRVLYETITKKRTFGCKLKQIISLGLARCR